MTNKAKPAAASDVGAIHPSARVAFKDHHKRDLMANAAQPGGMMSAGRGSAAVASLSGRTEDTCAMLTTTQGRSQRA